jgi:hypothetical protein
MQGCDGCLLCQTDTEVTTFDPYFTREAQIEREAK